jgi:uncharacterized protein (TIGR02266 family)
MSQTDFQNSFARAVESLSVVARLAHALELPAQAREAIEKSFRQMSVSPVEASEVSQRSGYAMDHLRRALELIQQTGEERFEEASRSVARTLAILYPLSKMADRPSGLPGSPGPAKMGTGSERRQARRLDIQAEIGIESDSNFFMGLTEDISTGGIFIATYDVRTIGSPMTINFTLPDGHLVSAEGVVRWVREYQGGDSDAEHMPGMGVQFTALTEQDQHAIEAFVRYRQPIFYDD